MEAFDIYRGEELVGFALLRRNEDGSWFLWDYAMGRDYRAGLGEAALRELIALFQREKGMKKLVTTYIWGNDQAKHLYEKVGLPAVPGVGRARLPRGGYGIPYHRRPWQRKGCGRFGCVWGLCPPR